MKAGTTVTAIRVLLADDHQGVRTGIRQLLEKTADIQVIGEAATGAETLQLVQQLAPDLLLLDMALPDLSGVEVAQRLHESASGVRILALSAYSDEQYITGVLDNGAAGYLTQATPTKSILLTKQEQAVLTLAATGVATNQIALRLQVSTAIVQFHIQNICNKFQVHSLQEAITPATQQKLI
jgi:DNA-binding NarL/FixJ family response regulator